MTPELVWKCTDCSQAGIEQRILFKVLWYNPFEKKYNEELICLPCLKKRLNETEPTKPIEYPSTDWASSFIPKMKIPSITQNDTQI